MRVKEKTEKACLKLNIKKLRSWHQAPSLHCKLENWKEANFIFLASKVPVDDDCSHEIKTHSLLGRRAMTAYYKAESSLC